MSDDAKATARSHQVTPRWRQVSGITHLWVSLFFGALVGAVAHVVNAQLPALLIGWLGTTALFVVWIWASIWSLDAQATAELVQREDPGRLVIRDAVLVLVTSGSLLTVVFVIFRARESGLALTLCAVAVVTSSWAVLHTIMATRYARLFYAQPKGGIDFNQSDDPAFRDFAYLAFTVGMTFQVSDTAISNSRIRTALLGHALISFVYATFIVAVSVNLVAGLSR